MIISASRRTDIPTYYSDWFMQRIKEGYVLARNPMNAHQVSRISLNPEVVDGIVFWTKNPLPMLDKLALLKDYMYYFQFTLNGYEQDVEAGVPPKDKFIVPGFQRLGDMLGPERVIWRYDPILLNNKYTFNYHMQRFAELAKQLAPYTKQCTISFLDMYAKTERNMQCLAVQPWSLEQMDAMAKALSEIAHSYGLELATCAEGIELEKYGIKHAHCIDGSLFEKLLGCPMKVGKDKNQRQECGCVESVDIGAYNTCRNGCRYCYANFNNAMVQKNRQQHHPGSALLLGEVGEEDKITERKMHSCLERQQGLFAYPSSSSEKL